MALSSLPGAAANSYVSATAITAATDSAIGAAITSLQPIGNITGEVTGNFSNNTSELNTRASAQTGYKSNVFGLKSADIKFKLAWQPDDDNFEILFNGWNDKTEVFYAGLDQAKTVTGAQGPAGNFIVSEFSKSEPVDGSQAVDVTLLPSSFVKWYKKASS